MPIYADKITCNAALSLLIQIIALRYCCSLRPSLFMCIVITRRPLKWCCTLTVIYLCDPGTVRVEHHPTHITILAVLRANFFLRNYRGDTDVVCFISRAGNLLYLPLKRVAKLALLVERATFLSFLWTLTDVKDGTECDCIIFRLPILTTKDG